MLEKLRSIKTKIIVLYLILLLITLFFSGFLLQTMLRDFFSDWLSDRLLKEVELVREVIPSLEEVEDVKQLDDLIVNYGDKLDIRLTVVDNKGLVLSDSKEDPSVMDNHRYRPEIQKALREESGQERRYSSTIEAEMHYLALPIYQEGEVVGVIRGAMDIEQLDSLYQDLWRRLFQIGVAALLISILLSIKFASQITEPLRDMTAAAEKIAAGFLDQKLVVKTRDEIGKLGTVFNRMVTRIQDQIDKISSEKSKVTAILSSIGDGIVAVNKNREIIMLNRAAEDMFGVKEGQVLGNPSIQVLRNHKLEEMIAYSLEEVETFTEEVELLLPEEKLFRISLAPIHREGEVKGSVISLRDITEIRDLQQMRTEFVGNVTHELKTPLTSIKGYVETLIESDPDPETYQSFLKVIADETERLDRLITDTLDLSKIETARQLAGEKISVKEIVEDIRPILKPQAKESEVDLEFDLQSDLPTVTGDKDKLAQALINLIDNGIKYTPVGGKVEVRSYEKEAEIAIEVKDNGIGIPEKDLSRIFERFYRVDKARSRRRGGTGLGLSIVKHIIKLHRGKIEVESELEVGSKFIVRLPQ